MVPRPPSQEGGPMVRAILLTSLTALLPVVPGAAAEYPGAVPGRLVGAPPPTAARSAWVWPLEPRPAVARPFHAPPTPWGAGHRGVDLAARVGQPVRAPAAGAVTFSGRVAGRGVLVVTHSGGLRSSFEPVDGGAPVGRSVAAGEVLARLSSAGGHCVPASCLHWGVRDGEHYIDPLRLLARPSPVLLPQDSGG